MDEKHIPLYLPLIDRNVRAVQEILQKRMEVGFKKYGTTTERTDLTSLEWLQHLQEELLDAAIYIQKLKETIHEIERLPTLVKNDSNLSEELISGLPGTWIVIGSGGSSGKD